ncbi:MAG TPA: hypothetical protein PLB67_04715 [Candidatus Hydrogenedentes bacterium]|jgi:hypothetical protein|nr:hypothetical protein [Candidatus Hydrogenedentota bacterium]MDY0031148.1 hypothetical protein [FCB group bacterium]NLT61679.1 hypothetical protein [Candidatus Hydrogenedentota bacterium]HNV20321.1 hypothetical protein [Candidatus Hydrogenedentota bacterium]HNZ17481.1 hypothetical protein [Candidatus Hydrogenedentota bacterium]
MAFGDIGGVLTELVITCKTPDSGPVSIAKGDAVKLAGPYTVTNDTSAGDSVFGEALAGAAVNGAAIPVKVRGVSVFQYEGETPPVVDGVAGVVAAATSGKVMAPATGNGTGINLKVDTAAGLVHVLL